MKHNEIKVEKPKYWMYNAVSDNPVVWQHCLQNNCAVMSYIKGLDTTMKKALENTSKVKVGDYVVAYLPPKRITALGKVTKPLYEETDINKFLYKGMNHDTDKDKRTYAQRIGVDWYKVVNEPIKIDKFEDTLTQVKSMDKTVCAISELEEVGFKNAEKIVDLMIGKCSDKDISDGKDTKLAIEKIEIPKVSFDKNIHLKGLYFQDKDIIISQIKTALKNGKNIILIGPPGTGKSKLAKEICKSYDIEYKMYTATSEWSIYETIGGYKQDIDGQLYFDEGIFLTSIKESETKYPLNRWLIINEINRGDIEKVFSSIFSALTEDEITLSFKAKSKNNIIIRPQRKNEEYVLPLDFEYVIPRDWRIIGTMNTYDKVSLYEMSHAFRRRFAFIPISIPRKIDKELIENYLNIWQIEDKSFNNIDLKEGLSEIWSLINKYRIIGPAIMEDVARYVSELGDYTSAIILYVFPQFEGIIEEKIIKFVEELCSGNIKELINEEMLKNFAEDFWGINLE